MTGAPCGSRLSCPPARALTEDVCVPRPDHYINKKLLSSF
jgi:hypothetical protein